jgi:hypothetical protein
MYAKLSSLKIFAYTIIITYLTVIFQRLEKYYLSVLGLSSWDKGFLGEILLVEVKEGLNLLANFYCASNCFALRGFLD